MNVKIHNKFEISQGNEHYVAYNTLTYHIIESVANLQPFATYFALGSGTQTITYNSSKLGNWTRNFATTLEEVQCDISKGQLYAKRTLTIGENDAVGMAFCELGITGSNESNPTICNHVFVLDDYNNITSVVKKRGQALFIRVTIYLELDSASKALLCSGNNLLVKALLGEYSGTTWSVMRGSNTQPNSSSIYRNTPRLGTAYSCEMSHEVASNLQSATITWTYDIGTGETAEIVVLLDGTPVARYNVLESSDNEPTVLTITSQKNYTLPVDEYVSSIVSVTDANEDAVTGYVQKKYATEFSDYIASPFDTTFSADSQRWLSEDGDKIAYISGGKLNIYLNSNYSLKKIGNNVSIDNLSKVIMFENHVFLIYSASPYLMMYDIVDGELVYVSVDMTAYQTFTNSFDWQDIQIISNGQNSFTFGIVLGQIDRRAVVARATLSGSTLTFSSANYGQVSYVCNTFALYRNSFCDSMIGFVTNSYNGTQNNYRIEQYYANGTSEVTNELVAYYLVNNTLSLQGKSRAVIAKKSTTPYIWLYYYPQVYRYSISLTAGVDNWVSTNLLYLIQKYEDENNAVSYKIYSLTDYNNPIEFTDGFPQEIDQSTIRDFEFLKDTLLIFTTSQTYAINLKETKLVLENMPDKEADYTVDFRKTVLKGESASEGVNGTFTVGVSV